jgi:hypothetical protein
MTVMPIPGPTGRGAWTKRGMKTTRGMYERGCSYGVSSSDTQDKWAVNRGVLAVQNLLGYNGYPVAYGTAAGMFGPLTDAATLAFQKDHVPPADGLAGPNTLRALLRKLVAAEEKENGIPDRLLWGLIGTESNWDPGCVGYSTPLDLGLMQFSLYYNQSISPDQAMDPFYSVDAGAKRLRTRFNEYKTLTTDTERAWDAAALGHNSPVRARIYARTGVYPTTQAADYVAKVRKFAKVP